ncbi:hybrid sensor histidine kinase/response regulator [Actibacterium pelagium]|uniref:histidine kinase n=1 Tax=Actibacterium pelagium TaxID=2029103 RepID=A0A917AIX8_9RHOB|nr:PAS-domain containing protein [Actibacterium pelagium]GGE54664.1 hybrid sensor histidine kinase/response regulator [Actibacterium pelagium]
MLTSLIDENDSLERQNEKLRQISEALMRRVEQDTDESGAAYAQFQRAAMLEEVVRARTGELERALDLLNDSNAKLADANAETELARANLANAIETVQEGFALFNADEELVMCNSRFGKHMQDVHPQLKPGLKFRDYVQMVSTSPYLSLPDGETPESWAAYRMERHKDDSVVFNARMAGRRWLQVSEHRTPDNGTVVLQTDVTDIMRLERQERERLLDDQARLIRATLEHLNQGVCIFDIENRLVGWNRRVGELLSIPINRLQLGTSFRTLYTLVGEQMRSIEPIEGREVEEWVQSPLRRAPLSFEIGVGANRTLAAFAQQMPNGGFVISFTDVSAERAAVRAISEVNETLERRVTERTLELEDALSEAERANASKSRFVAAASHDLLQPLSAAKLFVSSLETDLENPEYSERLSKASNALLSVENILGALLDISKLDSGQAAMHVGTVSLDLILRQLSDELRPMAEAKGLEFRIVPTKTQVISDTTYLRRILQNLISNAIRYTERGKVLVGARRRKGSVRIEVWDTGPGIPEDQQDRIFDEFHRVNASVNPADGMGLGLAIVERACRLLEHPLHLKSDLGWGTKFSVEFTRAPELEDPSDQSKEPRPTPSRVNLDNSIVLLIENNSDLRAALTITMENWGVSVLPCHDQTEAEEILAELEIAPDAIIADYQLDDDKFGTDAIAHFKSTLGPIPACLITADRKTSIEDRCKSVGAELFHKPIDQGVLQHFLEKAVSGDPT